MDIYVIRHGETEWNVMRRIQGKTDIELNEKGRALARETGRALAHIPFALAFSSPLKRAAETARILLEGREVPILFDDRLMELSFGVLEGEVMSPDNPRFQGTAFLNFFSDPAHYTPPEGGESLQQLCRRTTSFLQELAAKEELADANVLVSSHGAAIKGLLSSLYPSTIENFWHGGVHPNCGVSLIRVEAGQIRLIEEGRVYKS